MPSVVSVMICPFQYSTLIGSELAHKVQTQCYNRFEMLLFSVKRLNVITFVKSVF